MPPARTSRSDCAASAVSVSRLTDRRRQRGPSAGATAHVARHLSSKTARRERRSAWVRSIEARQILARFSDDASFPTYLFLYSLLYFGDVIYVLIYVLKVQKRVQIPPLRSLPLHSKKEKQRFSPLHALTQAKVGPARDRPLAPSVGPELYVCARGLSRPSIASGLTRASGSPCIDGGQ